MKRETSNKHPTEELFKFYCFDKSVPNEMVRVPRLLFTPVFQTINLRGLKNKGEGGILCRKREKHSRPHSCCVIPKNTPGYYQGK